jgi:arsenite-transporting ATPase
MDYETVVFDTAPTGHTLRLLQIPATLDKALGKLSSMQGAFGGMLGQLTSMLGGPAEGTDNIMAQMDQLKVWSRIPFS